MCGKEGNTCRGLISGILFKIPLHFPRTFTVFYDLTWLTVLLNKFTCNTFMTLSNHVIIHIPVYTIPIWSWSKFHTFPDQENRTLKSTNFQVFNDPNNLWEFKKIDMNFKIYQRSATSLHVTIWKPINEILVKKPRSLLLHLGVDSTVC